MENQLLHQETIIKNKPATNTRLAPFANLVELSFRIKFSLSRKLSVYELPAISKRARYARLPRSSKSSSKT